MSTREAMNIIEKAIEAGFQVDEEGEPFIYFKEQWIDVTAQLTKFAELLQAQASEPVAWILDHTPNRGMRQVSCSKPYVDDQMSKGVEWNTNKFSQGQYPYDVCTPLYTSPPNTQAKLDKAREALKLYARRGWETGWEHAVQTLKEIE
jgi:hypothetical protein